MSSNLGKLKAAFEIWQESLGKNSAPWFELVDENVVFRSAAGGREPMGAIGNYTRKAALKNYFDFIATQLEMIEHTIEHYFEEDDLVITIGNSCWRVRQTGRVFRSRTAKLFWFREGKIVRHDSLFDSAAMMEACGANLPASNPAPEFRARRR